MTALVLNLRPAFFLGLPGTPEMIIIGVILVFLFGGAKLPKLARSIGESIVEFKKGVKGDKDDEKGDDKLPEGSDPKRLPKDD